LSALHPLTGHKYSWGLTFLMHCQRTLSPLRLLSDPIPLDKRHRPFLWDLHWTSKKCKFRLSVFQVMLKWRWHVGKVQYRDRKIWDLQINPPTAFRGIVEKLCSAPIETDSSVPIKVFYQYPGNLFTLSGFFQISGCYGTSPDGWFYQRRLLERDIGILENWIRHLRYLKILIIMNDSTETIVFWKCCKEAIDHTFRLTTSGRSYNGNAPFFIINYKNFLVVLKLTLIFIIIWEDR